MLDYLFLSSRITSSANAGEGSAARAAHGAVDQAMIPVESRIDALELACAAMWDLLKKKGGLTDDELIRAIEEVDGRDGKVDGKMRPVNESCPNCNRRLVTKSRKACVWCGAALKASPF